MATLDSSSTLTQAVAAYRDNLSYLTDDSTAKALAFIEACTWILEARPSRAEMDDQLIVHGLAHIERRLEAAQDWVSTRPDAPGLGTTYADFRVRA